MPSNPASASKFAYAAAAFFVIGMALVISQHPPMAFAGAPPPLVTIVTLAFTLFHLSLLPLVAALPAPEWAKGSGYAWIVVDNVIVFLSYFGVGADLIVPLRWGVHIGAATWIAGASASAGGAIRSAGWLAAVALVAASLAGPYLSREIAQQTLGPGGLLLVIWLVLVGRRLAAPNRAIS